jgi:hypothetical protein
MRVPVKSYPTQPPTSKYEHGLTKKALLFWQGHDSSLKSFILI